MARLYKCGSFTCTFETYSLPKLKKHRADKHPGLGDNMMFGGGYVY